jgi:hypothetical protein
LSDQPALTPEESFYQRLLANDAAEATYEAELCLKDQSLEGCLGQVALSALKLADHDTRRELLDETQATKISDTMKEVLANLDDFEPRRWFFALPTKKPATEGKSQNGLATLAAAEAAAEEEDLPVVQAHELAPGWEVDEPILCIGGRTALDEAAAAMLAKVLKKRGLGANTLGPEAISAAHIASLAGTEAKLVCLSYLNLGLSPAHVRYLVRRLRRILPESTAILVCYWSDENETPAAKQLVKVAEADAYATSLSQAVEFSMAAARGELRREQTVEESSDSSRVRPFPVRDKPKRLEQKTRNPASAS